MILYRNRATSTLASAITDSQTTITVATGDGTKFPSVSGADVFYVTLSTFLNQEILKVTSRTNDVLTVVRAQEGTTARAWSLGDSVAMLITAGVFEDLRDNRLTKGNPILSSVTPAANGELVFEATSNTLITVKYKGSDGVVRTGTIPLS